MNPANEQVLLIPLELLVKSSNTRKTVDAAALVELAASIKEHGVQTPIIVRNADMSVYKGHIQPEGGQLYEIVVGHRRVAACRELGLKAIPAILRTLDDASAKELQVIENLQRQDIHPLDEADAYADLITAHVGGVVLDDTFNSPALIQAVALRIAKPIEYVTRRLKLRNLIEHSRQAFLEGLITLDHALLLAKLGPVEQEKVLRHTLSRFVTSKPKTEQVLAEARANASSQYERGGGYYEPTSVTDTKEFIERELKLELKKAPWDLADAHLVESAGACTTCPSNTAYNTALFGDLAIEDATCTDSVCFNAKRDAFVLLQLKALEPKQPGAVLKLSWKFSSVAPRKASSRDNTRWTGAAKWEDGFAADQVFKQGQWIKAEKSSCEYVTAGVAIDFEEAGYGVKDARKPGTKLLVCVAAKCKAHKKEWEKPKQSNGGSSRSAYDAKAEEEKKKKREAEAAVETQVRFGNAAIAIEKIKTLSAELLRGVILDWAGNRHHHEISTKLIGFNPLQALKNEATDSKEFARAVVAVLISGDIKVGEWVMGDAQRLKSDRADFAAKMILLGSKLAPDTFGAKAKPTAKPAKKTAKKVGRA